MTVYLDLEDAVPAIERLGFQVREAGLLGSALARPAANMYGQDAYSTLEEKAAVLLESLARNHPLFDGNKRTAWHLLLAFLRLNGFRIVIPEDQAFDLVVGVAEGRIEWQNSAPIIARHLVRR